jgi:Crinkler effector protein N-terminal domain
MSAAMAAIRVLCCLVDGEHEVFKVKVQTSDDMMDLKKRIHEEGIDMTYQVRSKRLTLWKVSTVVYVGDHAAVYSLG